MGSKQSHAVFLFIVTSLFFVAGNVYAALSSDMQVGSKGNQVQALQQFLIVHGYLSGTATSQYGSATKAAVMKYQRAHNIKVTGIVGPITRNAINSDSNSASNQNSQNASNAKTSSAEVSDISLNGNSFVPGQTIKLSWTQTDTTYTPRVNLYDVDKDQLKLVLSNWPYTYPKDIPPGTQLSPMESVHHWITWTIPNNYESGQYSFSISKGYGLRSESLGKSSTFTINGDSSSQGISLIITNPTTPTNWRIGEDQMITWIEHGLDSEPLNIYLNGGSDYKGTLLGQAVGKDGSFTVKSFGALRLAEQYPGGPKVSTATYPTTGYARGAIRIETQNPVMTQNAQKVTLNAQSKEVIAILLPNPTPQSNVSSPVITDTGETVPSIKIVSPNGGEVWKKGQQYRIVWNASNADRVVISATHDAYGDWIPSIDSLPNTGYFDWIAGVKGTDYSPLTKICIRAIRGTDSREDCSDNFFTIVP